MRVSCCGSVTASSEWSCNLLTVNNNYVALSRVPNEPLNVDDPPSSGTLLRNIPSGALEDGGSFNIKWFTWNRRLEM